MGDNYPQAFLKKRSGYCNRLRPSVHLSVMLSPPKPFEELQPNLVCELLTWMGRATSNFFLAPSPGALGRGQKIKYNLISITKSISKIFIPNFVCVLTNERYKTYQTGFSFCPLGGTLGRWGCPGGQKKIIQTWSCGISNRRGWRAEQNASKIFILGSNWWPWGEVKGQISLNFGYHVSFKEFYTKFCVCSHKWNIQNISDGIFIVSPGSCPRGGTLGHWGYPGGQTIYFFKHGHVAYQIDGDDEQNKIKVTFSS